MKKSILMTSLALMIGVSASLAARCCGCSTYYTYQPVTYYEPVTVSVPVVEYVRPVCYRPCRPSYRPCGYRGFSRGGFSFSFGF